MLNYLELKIESSVWQILTSGLLLLALAVFCSADVVAEENNVAATVSRKIDLAPIQLPPGLKATTSSNGAFSIHGRMKSKKGVIVLKPKQEFWDISSHSFFQISLKNSSDNLVWIRGRLDNHRAQDWANSTASSVFILPGETAMLGFPFPRPWEQNDAPEIFNMMSAKPNGHRTHWKRFDPKRVVACRLNLQSTSHDIQLEDLEINLNNPYGMDANAKLANLPFLDRFGQAKNLNWEDKVTDVQELKTREANEAQRRSIDAGPKSFNRFGSWANGPKLDATGYFRLAKHEGKWWFVDPNGKLFYSNGINTIGFRASTPIAGRRELFEWLPSKDSPVFQAMVNKKNERNFVSFICGNVFRTFGDDWKQVGHERIQKRLRRWGINTIGAWSDKELTSPSSDKSLRAPYTGMLHLWRRHETRLDKNTPDPFADDFAQRVSKGLQGIVDSRGHDPWCIGVFIDNEIEWHDDLVERVFAAPSTQPAKIEFVKLLKQQYEHIEKLNSSWAMEFGSWDDLMAPQQIKVTKNRRKDFDWLYGELASCYYRICRDEMRRIMPHHLYLGSRIHKCPKVVAKAAARYVDVYSINSYVELANKGSLPGGVDKPVLIAEFHFAASERGLGVGLSPVGDRLQRSRAFGAFVVNGLLDPHVVGTHWFAYADQSAAGRPYENYQIGFVDVTDTPYPMISEMSRKIADQMYRLRSSPSENILDVLAEIWDQ